jgi:dihydrofolate reductase
MAASPEFKLIVALCRGGGIGLDGTLPWPKLDRDLRFFSQMTRSTVFPYNSAVVMGRKTWESIPANAQPLPFRDNIVISAMNNFDTEEHSPGVTFIKTLSDVHKYAGNYDVVWFIGGASIYEQILTPTSTTGEMLFPINDILITFVDESYEHDAAFPLMYQYQTIEEWQSLRNNPTNRAIWCWTGGDHIPEFVSFFAEGTQSNHVYHIMDADRDFVASITRPRDIKAIQERRSPNTIFLHARLAAHHHSE